MYAIIKTGSKQYKVQAGDFINIEKLDGEVGDKVEFEAIFVSDDGKVIADPKKAAATKVEGEIVEQFKDKKVIVFKFKKRKNYQRKVGHRQPLTRVQILAVGDDKVKVEKKKAEKPAKKEEVAKEDKVDAEATSEQEKTEE
jgi:large subunit ribosomal protein L21